MNYTAILVYKDGTREEVEVVDGKIELTQEQAAKEPVIEYESGRDKQSAFVESFRQWQKSRQIQSDERRAHLDAKKNSGLSRRQFKKAKREGRV